MELTIKIKGKDFDRVTTFLKTLDVEIIMPSESKADAWKRVGQDKEMTVLANAGLDDFKNMIMA